MLTTDQAAKKVHIKLAQLEREGHVQAVVTQSIDGLHQAAGSSTVYELHGSANRYCCMDCDKRFDLLIDAPVGEVFDW